MKEALKLALEALEAANSCVDGYYIPKGKTQLPEVEEAITAINEALAQPEQEPVAFEDFNEWMHYNLPVGTVIGHSGWWADKIYNRFIKQTIPPQRTWVGLTDEHPLMVFAKECVLGAYQETELTDAAQRAIKAAHGIKE